MPITGQGWEFLITRQSEQRRASDGKRRTVGKYEVFHDGVKQTATDLSGTVAETRGPGANQPAGNNRRIEAGRYPISTQDGTNYVTIGYTSSPSVTVLPRPAIELNSTGKRAEILIHPGIGFLSRVGCISPTKSLPNAAESIDFKKSRARLIAIIEDLKAFLGSDFPTKNGKKIPNAAVVIDGEPNLT